jgi:hypothetical protein
VHLSNTYNLISNRGWSGVLIESDAQKYGHLVRNMSDFSTVLNICSRVSDTPPMTLDAVLSGTPIPKNFDLLSIDVDNDDYLIWKSFREYRPRVVVIEVNSSYPPGIEKIPLAGYDGQSERKRGASIGSMVLLAKEKGYELALHTGNAILVLRELADKLEIDQNHWQELFDSGWIRKPHQRVWDSFRRRVARPHRWVRSRLQRTGPR